MTDSVPCVCEKCGAEFLWYRRSKLCPDCDNFTPATRNIRVQMAIERNLDALLEISHRIAEAEKLLSDLNAEAEEYRKNILTAAIDPKADKDLP